MKKTINLSEYELAVIVDKDPTGGFIARCRNWSDCYAQGDTIEEVVSEIGSVATSLIELYKEENLPIPLKLKNSSRKPANSFSLNFPIITSA